MPRLLPLPFLLALAVAAAGCVDDDRCGPNQVLEDGVCLCADGTVPPGDGAGDCEPAPDAQPAASDAAPCGGDAGCADASTLPTGLGASCSSSADCAAYEATYCESFQSHTCQVEGCTLEPDDCYPGSICCDLTAFGMPTLCVPEGQCPTG
jgi:hypothetical protein